MSSLILQLPIVSHLLRLEKGFNVNPHLKWFELNWNTSIWISVVYVLFVFIGRIYMTNRQPYDLRLPLGIWSLFLSIFSLFGSMRMVPELLHSLSSQGFTHSFCQGDFKEDPRINFWIMMFTWSKVFELVDTGFIVLRKQKLIFLHWYHHFMTLIYCFFAVSRGLEGPFRWFATMNFAIHTVMYGYYAVKALRLFQVPSIVNQVITTGQIVQMIMGFVISISLLIMQTTHPKKCDFSLDSNIFSFLIYLSYLILFVNFFIQTYLMANLKRGQKISSNYSSNNNNIEDEGKKMK